MAPEIRPKRFGTFNLRNRPIISRKSRNVSDDNSLCILKTKASQGTKLRSYFKFYSFHNIIKDQLYRIIGSAFCEQLFGPETMRDGTQTRSNSQLLRLCCCQQPIRSFHELWKELGTVKTKTPPLTFAFLRQSSTDTHY